MTKEISVPEGPGIEGSQRPIRKILWGRNRLPTSVSWASLVAQLVKNSPAMWETWVQSLGWENPLEKGKATHSSILVWRNCTVHGITNSQTRLSHFHFTSEPCWVGGWRLVVTDEGEEEEVLEEMEVRREGFRLLC